MSRLEKAMDHLGETALQELEAMGPEQLKTRIIQAEQEMEKAEVDLAKNAKYQAAKEAIGDCTASKKEINKRQKAIITVCLAQLESKGQ